MQHKELSILQISLLSLVIFLGSFVMESAFAESEIFTVAARDYERKYIPLTEGDEIEYTVNVSGGKNNDIKLTIYDPNGNDDGEVLCMKGLVMDLRHSHLAHTSLSLTVRQFLQTSQ